MKRVSAVCASLIVVQHLSLAVVVDNDELMSLDRVQDLRRAISSELLEVKKKHPDAGGSVYTALDHLESICEVCKNMSAQNDELRESLAKESVQSSKLLAENKELSRDAEKLREQFTTIEEHANTHRLTAAKLQQERDEYELRAQEATLQTKSCQEQVKIIRETLAGKRKVVPGSGQTQQVAQNLMRTSTSEPTSPR